MVRTSWIYLVKKEDLVTYLKEFGLDTAGTVEDLRRRFAAFIAEHGPEHEIRLLELEAKYPRASSPARDTSPAKIDEMPRTKGVADRKANHLSVPENLSPCYVTRDNDSQAESEGQPLTRLTSMHFPQNESTKHHTTAEGTAGYASTMDKVRKWSVRFDGSKCPLVFVDRVEELANVYDLPLGWLPRTMPELLKDRALLWHRNNNKRWQTWKSFREDFLRFFLPPRYFEHLEDRIRGRYQQPREVFNDNVIAMLDLMRPAMYTDVQKLERIYRNSRQEYQLHIKRREFSTLDDLMLLAGDYEEVTKQSPPRAPRPHNEWNRQVTTDTTTAVTDSHRVNVRSACRRCGQNGHFSRGCRNPSRLFCWTCGQTNTCTIDCCGRGARTTPRTTQVRMADDSKRIVSEALTVKAEFGQRSYNLTLLVLPEAVDDVVLGMDFLFLTGTTITIANQSTTLEETPPIHIHRPRCTVLRESNRDSSAAADFTENPTTSKFNESIHASDTDPANENEQVKIDKFLSTELPLFDNLTGTTDLATHRITMKDDQPVKQRYVPRNPAMLAIINKEIDELLANNCIEPSRSPHSSPIVLVRKKTGKWRLCIDFRQVNAKSIPDAYPLPRIQSILDRLREARYVSTLDLKNGYWQIPMEEDSKAYTAFTVPGRGLFQWRVMPFGLHSAPATFQRTLDRVIGPELEPFAFAYLDDIIVIGKTIEEHISNLRRVFQRLRAANLKINPEKCEFFKKELRYLGHVVSQEGVHTDPDKVAAIRELQPPTNVKQLRRCLGIASWYRRFVPEFAEIVHPLTELLKKGKHWRWENAQQKAFDELKARLTTAPILACPDFEKPFVLQTDASDHGLGAVLTQELDGAERVIAYASRRLNKVELNYSPTAKECLAIVWGIRQMRPYVEGYKFIVITDPLSLKWLNSISNPTGRIARWTLELQQYSFDIHYRRGKLNVVADALSRQPLERFQRAELTYDDGCNWTRKKMEEVKRDPAGNADYVIIEGRLYRHIQSQSPGEDNTRWKLCVPTAERPRVLAENHATATAGHLGVRKTIARIANNYYWPGMMRDIARYVRACDSCQKYKASQQQPAGEMLTKIAQAPWETLCADFIGPLPRSKHGNTMLLVFFDKFSKWVELVPLRRATGETLQKAFRHNILSRFGTPKVLICDNGTQFTCKKFQRFLEEMGVHQQFTAPYTPQENPTERANRTIKTIIAQVTKDDHRLWDELLPEITLAINSSVSESTGYSPAFLMQGRELRLPGQLYDEDALGNGLQPEKPNDKQSRLNEVYNIVRHNLQKAANSQAKYYNLRRRKWVPTVGQKVLVKQHPLSRAVDNFAAKLAPRFEGLFTVWRFKSPVIVELRHVITKKLRTAHIADLKSYYDGEDHQGNLRSEHNNSRMARQREDNNVCH